MSRSIYDKQLVRWVKSHYWDSLEKDKDIILRHIRTFAGGNVEQETAEALKPSHNSDLMPLLSDLSCAIHKAIECEDGLDGSEGFELLQRIDAVVAQQH